MQVAQVWRYPIKSLGGERLDASQVSELGLVGDRSWGIEDVTTGKILTGRREPALLLADGRLDDDGAAQVHVDGQVITADADLSDWLGRPVRLTRASDDSGGTFEAPADDFDETNSGWMSWSGPHGAFHDSTRTRVSLISMATLGGEDPRRFRANLVLAADGADHAGAADPEASTEDRWVGLSLRVGTVTLNVRKHIGRCVMVTRPQPGLPRDLEVLKRVNTTRDGVAAIGALVTQTGQLAVGDTVTPERAPGVAHLVRPATSRVVNRAARQLPRLDRLRRRIPRRT
ncbi:MAG: MOSC N-terminal beta barrel domain-containing protein [Microthrixaceae bacterium]